MAMLLAPLSHAGDAVEVVVGGVAGIGAIAGQVMHPLTLSIVQGVISISR
jgi:hypothetical protein